MLHQNFIAEMFVGKDPEASYTPDGRFVVKFPAAGPGMRKRKSGLIV